MVRGAVVDFGMTNAIATWRHKDAEPGKIISAQVPVQIHAGRHLERIDVHYVRQR